MSFRTSWVENDKLIVINLRFTPIPIWIGLERISVIVEIRDAKSGKIREVWHLHVRYNDGKIVHRDRKYPWISHIFNFESNRKLYISF